MWRLTRRPLTAPPSFILQWHITERCNQRCAHCYQDSLPAPELPFDRMLAVLPQFTALLDSLPGPSGSPRPRGQVTVTGGEPTLHSHFMELLEVLAASKSRFSFAVLANGTGIDRAAARRLARLRPQYVQISVDGVEATHDAIRGPGSFREATAALRHLAAAGVATSLSFTAHRLNFREFPAVARLGRRIGVTRVWADRLIPSGRGAALETLSPEETREFVALLRKAREEAARAWFGRTVIAMHRALQFLDGGAPYRCTAGLSLLALLPDGTVLPCRRMPIPVGNIRGETLASIYQESPLLRQLRDPGNVAAGCTACSHQPTCRGGLRCLSSAVNGSPFHTDPGCWLAHGKP